jgi:ACS family hexuronate transporter-like MFS transporter
MHNAAVEQDARIGHVRWYVCGLLFLASTINYVDRQVIGILKPTLQHEFGWSEIDYGYIVISFQLAYAIGLATAGRLVDRLGTRTGLAAAVLLWSLAAMAHAGVLTIGGPVAATLAVTGLAVSVPVAGFMAARFVLGLAEAGNFPASIKTVAEWFPKRERAFATGIFNSGTNVGALVTPLIVPWLTISYGWRWAFIFTGALGAAWLLVWWGSYTTPDRHARVGPGELALIRSDPPEPAIHLPWQAVVKYPQAWAFALGKFMTDPVWWVYLFWIPDFLHRRYGLDLTSMGPPIVVIYLMADVGSIGGGWLSSMLIRRGWSVNAGRKTAMLLCALAVTPVVFAARASDLRVAIALIGLAAAAHQGWSANLFTLTSDTFPRQAVGSVVGFGGMLGAIGGMLIAGVTAWLLQVTGSYVPVFIVAALAYLVALLGIHMLVPRLEPAKMVVVEGSST